MKRNPLSLRTFLLFTAVLFILAIFAGADISSPGNGDDETIISGNISPASPADSVPANRTIVNDSQENPFDSQPVFPGDERESSFQQGERGWKFMSDLANSGVYDSGGIRAGGELLWKFPTEGYYPSSPAIVGGVVYASGIYDIYAIDAVTGELLWTSPHGGGQSSPAVTGGVVYAVSDNRNVTALDCTTGTLLWEYQAGSPVYSSPAVSNGILYTGSSEGKVLALDAGTGTLLWSYPCKTEVRSSPAVAGGTVYSADQGGTLYALDAETGTLLWNYTFKTGVRSSPAVAGGTVYSADQGGTLYALDAETGNLLWECPVPGGTGGAGPAISGGVIYIGSSDGRLYALEAGEEGRLLFSYQTGASIISSPAVSDGVVFTGSSDASLYALDAGSGELLWSFPTGNTINSNPAVANGIVYIQSTDGYLYVLTTLPDDPPASVTDLHAARVNGVEITWVWNEPRTPGFSHAMVFLDGVFQENVPKGKKSWTARGLAPLTSHTLSVRTVGVKGAANTTLVSSTATTTGLSIEQIDPAHVVEDSPGFTLEIRGTGFSPACAVLWNGNLLKAESIQADHLSVDIPAELVAHSCRVNITVIDESAGELSNAVTLFISDNPATAKARKFRADPNNTGVFDGSGRRPVPELLWKYTTGGSVQSSPAVVDGIVYIGSNDRNLYALDAETGTLIWKYDTMEHFDIVSSSPAVSNGVVYIGGLRNKIHALDALTGKFLWKYKLPIRTVARSGISSGAAVADGAVYIGNMDGGLYAFDEVTGDLLWKFSLPESETSISEIFSSPAISDGAVYIIFYSGHVYALDARTGEVLWRYAPDRFSNCYSSPAVSGGTVFVSGGLRNTFFALNESTGQVLWEFTTGGNLISSPAVAEGAVFFGSHDSHLYALNASSGALLWKFPTGGRVISSPAFADGIVYFGSEDGNLYALDASTGTLLWNYTTGESIHSSPAVKNGIVYFGCSDHSVYAVGSLPLDPPVADFTADVTSGNAPLEVTFTDTSTGVVTARFWDFGDGTAVVENNSVTQNHTYLFPGTFSVSLLAANPDGQDKVEKPGYITVRPTGAPPQAWFTAMPQAGYSPLPVRFTDRSMGSPVAWRWDFGDGNTSAEKNPSHTYTRAGTYRVTLIVFSAGGKSSSEFSIRVMERPPVPTPFPTRTITPFPTFSPGPTLPPRPGAPPVAFFKMNTSMGRAPLTVQFTDLSFNAPARWFWDFGNGQTSILQNPVTTFSEPGIYQVFLRVENAHGESRTYRPVYVR